MFFFVTCVWILAIIWLTFVGLTLVGGKNSQLFCVFRHRVTDIPPSVDNMTWNRHIGNMSTTIYRAVAYYSQTCSPTDTLLLAKPSCCVSGPHSSDCFVCLQYLNPVTEGKNGRLPGAWSSMMKSPPSDMFIGRVADEVVDFANTTTSTPMTNSGLRLCPDVQIIICHWAVSRNNIYLGVSCLCGRCSSSLHYCHTSSSSVRNNVPVGQQGGWKEGSWITGHWSSFCACLRPLTSLRGSHTAAKDFIKILYLLKSDDMLTLIYNMNFFLFWDFLSYFFSKE